GIHLCTLARGLKRGLRPGVSARTAQTSRMNAFFGRFLPRFLCESETHRSAADACPGPTATNRTLRTPRLRGHTHDADLAHARTALATSQREWEFNRIRQGAHRSTRRSGRKRCGPRARSSASRPSRPMKSAARSARSPRSTLTARKIPRSPEGTRPVRVFSTMHLVRSAQETDAEGAGVPGVRLRRRADV